MTDSARFQISIRGSLLILTAISIVLAVAMELNRRVENLVLNPYRVQSAADYLIQYMDETGHWPRGWDDLSQMVESKPSDLRQIKWLRDVRRNVKIDFAFDPNSMQITGETVGDDPSLRVIVAHDGTRHGATGDPDMMIYRYLQQRSRKEK